MKQSEQARERSKVNINCVSSAPHSYGTAWFDRLIDSESFRNKLGHHNPDVWFINGTVMMVLLFSLRDHSNDKLRSCFSH